MSTNPSCTGDLRAAGLVLALSALGFILVFSALAARFGYPRVLDQSPASVLPALIDGGRSLQAWWIAYAILPLGVVSAALLAHSHLASRGPWARLYTAAGVGAGVAMSLGLMRWSTLMWSLGESWLTADASTRAALEAMADAANRVLGNGLGEVVGETLLGLWLAGIGRAELRSAPLPARARILPSIVSFATLILAALLLLGAWRFAWSALASVTKATNVLLPLVLIALGAYWLVSRRSALQASTLKLAALVIAGVALVTPSDGAAAERVPEPMQEREVILHGFRAPSIGVELRDGWLGFHVGAYPTILDDGPDGKGRTTWFLKTGLTVYPFRFDAGSRRPSGPYLGVALMQGLGNAWDASRSATSGSGVFFDIGFRWAAVRGLDVRLVHR